MKLHFFNTETWAIVAFFLLTFYFNDSLQAQDSSLRPAINWMNIHLIEPPEGYVGTSPGKKASLSIDPVRKDKKKLQYNYQINGMILRYDIFVENIDLEEMKPMGNTGSGYVYIPMMTGRDVKLSRINKRGKLESVHSYHSVSLYFTDLKRAEQAEAKLRGAITKKTAFSNKHLLRPNNQDK